MRVLVTVASKHGATHEIADRLAEVLRSGGHSVDVTPPEDVAAVHGFDAVVIGSAVYAGRWRKEARRFVDRYQATLLTRPVWLFSSGPVGDPPMPEDPSPDATGFAELVYARDHHTFTGRIDLDLLGFGERALVRSLNAAVGDYRDWNDVTAWAKEDRPRSLGDRGAGPVQHHSRDDPRGGG